MHLSHHQHKAAHKIYVIIFCCDFTFLFLAVTMRAGYEGFHSGVNADDCCIYDIELYFLSFFNHRNYLYGGWILENVISL